MGALLTSNLKSPCKPQLVGVAKSEVVDDAAEEAAVEVTIVEIPESELKGELIVDVEKVKMDESKEKGGIDDEKAAVFPEEDGNPELTAPEVEDDRGSKVFVDSIVDTDSAVLANPIVMPSVIDKADAGGLELAGARVADGGKSEWLVDTNEDMNEMDIAVEELAISEVITTGPYPKASFVVLFDVVAVGMDVAEPELIMSVSVGTGTGTYPKGIVKVAIEVELVPTEDSTTVTVDMAG